MTPAQWAGLAIACSLIIAVGLLGGAFILADDDSAPTADQPVSLATVTSTATATSTTPPTSTAVVTTGHGEGSTATTAAIAPTPTSTAAATAASTPVPPTSTPLPATATQIPPIATPTPSPGVSCDVIVGLTHNCGLQYMKPPDFVCRAPVGTLFSLTLQVRNSATGQIYEVTTGAVCEVKPDSTEGTCQAPEPYFAGSVWPPGCGS